MFVHVEFNVWTLLPCCHIWVKCKKCMSGPQFIGCWMIGGWSESRLGYLLIVLTCASCPLVCFVLRSLLLFSHVWSRLVLFCFSRFSPVCPCSSRSFPLVSLPLHTAQHDTKYGLRHFPESSVPFTQHSVTVIMSLHIFNTSRMSRTWESTHL